MKAYRMLRARIEAFLALPLGTLQDDRAALKSAMDGIAAVTGPRGA
jgi:arsenate reductase